MEEVTSGSSFLQEEACTKKQNYRRLNDLAFHIGLLAFLFSVWVSRASEICPTGELNVLLLADQFRFMQFIKYFLEIDEADLSDVGGKGLNLGKLTRE